MNERKEKIEKVKEKFKERIRKGEQSSFLDEVVHPRILEDSNPIGPDKK